MYHQAIDGSIIQPHCLLFKEAIMKPITQKIASQQETGIALVEFKKRKRASGIR